MNRNGGPARKYSLTGREWLLVFLAAVGLHVLLPVLFCPLPRNVAERNADSRYTLLLDENELKSRQGDPYDLQYWLRYSDPERLLKPDMISGFSQVSVRKQTPAPDPSVFHHDLSAVDSAYRIPEPVMPSIRQLKDFSAGEIPPLSARPARENIAQPEPEYPVWTDETGQVFTGFFHADSASRQYTQQFRRASGPTVLLLRPGKGGLPPAVEILRSCGIVELDLLAKRQLMFRRENYSDRSVQGEKYFTVVWHSPQREHIRKESL